MSFTTEVKHELSGLRPTSPACDLAQLSALVRICGTLSYSGPGRFSIRAVTENGSVARAMYLLPKRLFGIETLVTVRRSVLHKAHNYLIEMPEQPGLSDALVSMGVLDRTMRLASGIEPSLVSGPENVRAYLRGAFMASGFVADPRGDFHLEIAVTGEEFASQLADLVRSVGAPARINRRRGAFAVYLKSFDGVLTFLEALDAERSAERVRRMRVVKSHKNEVNRLVNAELANQTRSVDAAGEQVELIRRAEELVGMRALPPAVREFCALRLRHPELSLRDLGEEASPPVSKSALYHRLLRLESIVRQAQEAREDGMSTNR